MTGFTVLLPRTDSNSSFYYRVVSLRDLAFQRAYEPDDDTFHRGEFSSFLHAVDYADYLEDSHALV